MRFTSWLALSVLGALAGPAGAQSVSQSYERAKFEQELKRSGFEVDIPIAADDPAASAKVRYEDMVGLRTARIKGQYPEIGRDLQAAVGEPLVTSFVYDVRIGAVLDGPVDQEAGKNRVVFASGDRLPLWGSVNPKLYVLFCDDTNASIRRPNGKTGGACMVDNEFDYRFDEVTTGFASGQALSTPVAYRLQPRTIKAVRFRSELIFLGVSNNVLRLGYREYVNELVRPAFNTELTYDLAAKGPTTFRYKSIEISVLSVSNMGVRYRIDRM